MAESCGQGSTLTAKGELEPGDTNLTNLTNGTVPPTGSLARSDSRSILGDFVNFVQLVQFVSPSVPVHLGGFTGCCQTALLEGFLHPDPRRTQFPSLLLTQLICASVPATAERWTGLPGEG